ncbi:MAG: NAD(P)/FAD-dependent oxidoreductase [Candidatus Dormibacteraeota bacterium]|nr:NAD(P)/FAD-dependent oxidoreductase [Candidatus Dormibacteraeota bacterium]
MNKVTVDVVVIGAGQAGLSTSYHLKQQGIDHVVLEEGRVGESWFSGRWDSFTLVTPSWTVQLPGFSYQGDEPDGFMGRDELVGYFDRYQASFDPPVRIGVTVAAVDQTDGGFVLHTSQGSLKARAVVVATGSYRRPELPPFAASLPAGITQVHSSAYRSPAQLPEGAILVVGTGQSGAQIAEELHEAGRRLFVSVSSCPRIPRRYRGKDIVWWAKMGGLYERTVDTLDDPAEKWACHPQSSGRRGGHDISLRQLASEGVTLTGRAQSLIDGVLTLAPDLSENLRKADEFAEKVLQQLDEVVSKMGMNLPEDENLRGVGAAVAGEEQPIPRLDLAKSGITSVVWATGYSPDFPFVRSPVFDAAGRPVQRRGVTATPGLYFIGLEWLYKPKSGLLLGVGEDAAYIASVIVGQAQSKSQRMEASS